MKTLFFSILIFFISLSNVSAADPIDVGGFIPVNPNSSDYDNSSLLKAKSLALSWIHSAYPQLTDRGQIISEVAINLLKKSTIQRPISVTNEKAVFNCQNMQQIAAGDMAAMVLHTNPLDIFVCPYSFDWISKRTKNSVKRLAQTMIHESWHLYEVLNDIKTSECEATTFEVAIVQINNGCMLYPSAYAKSCGINNMNVCN